MKRTVLFLCATNGVQSPMAEALLRRIDSEHFEPMSAGIEPGELHPLAKKVMREVGISIDDVRPSSIRALPARNVDFVITLCEHAKASSPRFPGAEHIHWHLEEPFATTDIQKQERILRIVRDQITQRLHLFVLVQVRARQVTAGVHSPSRAINA
jgi:arsenate reductase